MSKTLLVAHEYLPRVVEQWRTCGLASSTSAKYMAWVKRFLEHCDNRRLDVIKESCHYGLLRFLRQYSGPRKGPHTSAAMKACARNAIHAWSSALDSLGYPVPTWLPPSTARHLPALLEEFIRYRITHRGVQNSTALRELEVAKDLLQLLRERGRRVSRMRVVDVDEFVVGLSASFSPRTVADSCSRLRGFLRFLRATGRINRDMASMVVAPRVLRRARPPRNLSPDSVRRIIHAIPRTTTIGRRDHAMLLTMAAYGLGAAEVLALCLEHVQWKTNIIIVRRPKTGNIIELPLLPAVARTLSDYIRFGRPAPVKSRHVFLRIGAPHAPLTSGAIRHRIRLYANRSGVHGDILGAHMFRHNHATAQINAGVHQKVVSEILGHQRPSSTSAYIRVAHSKLRLVGLPVPR